MNKGSWGKIRAFFDVKTDEGFTMKGFKLVKGVNGLFVGFPSAKDKDDEYNDTIWAEPMLKNQLTEMAIEMYQSDTTINDIPQDMIQSEPTPSDVPVFEDEDIPF